MTPLRRFNVHLIAAALILAVVGLFPTGASAANGPAWNASYLTLQPTNLQPASSPWAEYNEVILDMANVGGAPTSGTTSVVTSFSPGLKPTGAELGGYPHYGSCEVGKPTSQDVTCVMEQPIAMSELLIGYFEVDTTGLAEGAPVSVQTEITGGGAPNARAVTEGEVRETPPHFGYLPGDNGLSGSLTGADGLPATQAGSHPGELTVQLGFPSKRANLCFGCGNFTSVEGGIRDARAYLPPGVIVNPQASAKLCDEALMEQDSCPPEAGVGSADVQSNIGFSFTNFQSPLFNIDTPPGHSASFAFDAGGIGIYPHILGGVREGGNYAIAAVANDILSLYGQPFFGFRTEFWGNPSDPIYDEMRGECMWESGPSSCPIEPASKALVTLPTSCDTGTLTLDANVDSWEEPGVFQHRTGSIIDSVGNPTTVTGCSALEFKPELEARPTTNVADSPTGLDFDLKITQNDSVNTLAAAHLRKAEVTLPEGLVINPSGANGLEGCTSAEVGIDPNTGEADSSQPSCPDSSRIGTSEVVTTLLDHPLPGSIYVAKPHDNPFDSLLAIYVVADDAKTNTLIKLSGELHPDPNTGQLTTTFDNNPQLPFTDFKLNFFNGALAPLRTPSVCGKYSTTSSITPWSAPDSGPPATPADNYEISQSPDAGNCATSADQRTHAPSFDAGTLAPVAGSDSPLVVNIRRSDGSQEFSSLTVTPPPGMLGKLAGVAYCPDSALTAAAAKTGAEEKANPSCPANSRIGSVDIGTGAGPAPYYVHGDAYLTGPYKGAPIGLAVVTPAVAGAYDLGTVVVRAALNINPVTAQITAVSDNLPTILQGIPLDIRSIQVKFDRSNFTLNPTSCDAMSFTGTLLSTLGQAASLQSRFQLGECVNLGFKPSLAIRLTGATKRTKNPGLVATLKARPGDANIARAQVKLPSAAFVDNAHIGDVCSRVQFDADACPPGSIYGAAEATSPLVDYTVSGPVYMRANPEHELPDLVAVLKGPDNQPIEVDLAGKTDSVKGALRNTFEAVPDVPVSTFRLELFKGDKSLIELSRNLCAKKYHAEVLLDAQNGLTADSTPVVGTDCKHKPKKARNHRHQRRRHGHRAR